MKKIIIVLLTLVLQNGILAQKLEVLKEFTPKDKRSGTMPYKGDSDIDLLTKIGNFAYFFIDNKELWRTDGTKNGTVFLKKFYGHSSAYGNNIGLKDIYEFNGEAYFLADDSTHGVELWKSNGTTIGTLLVKDIYKGKESGLRRGYKNNLNAVILNNKLYFMANDGINGIELWVTNGTNAGTKIVKDIAKGYRSSLLNFSESFTIFKNNIYFFANDGVHGEELWSSDGTEKGTNIFIDLTPGHNLTFGLMRLKVVGNQLYFNADSRPTNYGKELWVTDGTKGIVKLVKEIILGKVGSNPKPVVSQQNYLYFTISDNKSKRYELWVTQGTEATTQQIIMNKDRVDFNSYFKSFKYKNQQYISNIDKKGNVKLWTLKNGIATPATNYLMDGYNIIAPLEHGESSYFTFGYGNVIKLYKHNSSSPYGKVVPQASNVFQSGAPAIIINNKLISVTKFYKEGTELSVLQLDENVSLIDRKFSNISIYPNPSLGALNLIGLPPNGAIITIRNTLGKLINTHKVASKQAMIKIDLTGIFYLTITTDEGLILKHKIIITQ